MFLNFLQDAEQRTGTVVAGGDDLIGKLLVVQRRLRPGQFRFHETVPLSCFLK
jgi:hypothetical protein